MKDYDKLDKIKRRINESRKFRVVDDYFMKWRWWLLVVFLSVVSSIVYVFTQSAQFFNMGILLRLSISTCWAFTVIMIALRTFPKCGGGLMSISAIFFVVGSLTAFKEPLMFLAVYTMIISILLLFIEIVVGVRFIPDVKVKELPWCIHKEEVRNINQRSKG